MATDSDYADRFLNAAEAMKASLEKKYGRKFSGLGQARNHALENNNPIIRNHQESLKILVDLRNVMQHSHVLSGVKLATPRLDAVNAMEEIAEKVQNPPKIHDYMIKDPAVLAPTDSLADAAELVIKEGFSQIPIYDEGKYQALFTTNALARWLSDAVHREQGHLIEEAVTVSAVLQFGEDYDQPKFVKPGESANKVCDFLSSESLRSTVLVTVDGTSTGKLQGIVTRFDVPQILRKITTAFPA
ncbi:CBS domain-containing protein [Corynebacterium alimapuense]|uniref:CBS domain-containing protein n=1 Tax=Corynebacterium alimapuense TaxID=1576874 RepID=A0A3M8K7M0_9CORY|nr:CBS domain-containing protein [Corynebacterium alimapuense]RNE49227.1 hypothetical protein C5L39_02275 [Corynebacterium alimapuense]